MLGGYGERVGESLVVVGWIWRESRGELGYCWVDMERE